MSHDGSGSSCLRRSSGVIGVEEKPRVQGTPIPRSGLYQTPEKEDVSSVVLVVYFPDNTDGPRDGLQTRVSPCVVHELLT